MPAGQSGRALLLAATIASLVQGCAREGAPPGGPPDRLPPVVISSEPDTFSTVEPFRSPVTLRFSERISERPSAGTLDQAVVVSPVSGEVRVSHGREGLTVRVLGGFEAGRVYRLTVRPVIQDMFGNSLQEPHELFFSTGPDFVPNVVAGSVVDRLTGVRLADARVDAAVEGSEVVHTSVTDTAGIFALRYLPAGEYALTAYLDRNRNGEPDFTEPQRTLPMPLRGTVEATDTAIVLDVALLPRDTTSARLARVTVEDSASLRLSLDDYLDPESPLSGVQVTVTSDSVDAPEAMAVLHEHELEAYRRAAADSIARVRAVADSIAAAQAPVDSVAGTPTDSAGLPAAPAEDTTAVSDSARAAAPPAAGTGEPAAPGRDLEAAPEEEPERPRPQQTLIVILDGVLVPEVLYEVEVAGITNINGLGDGGGTAGFTRPAPPPPPEDTTQAATDSLPGDTIPAVLPEGGLIPDILPEGLAPPGDTVARDTLPAEPAIVGDSVAPADPVDPAADTVRRDTIPAAAGDSVPGDTVPDPPPADTARRDTIPRPLSARGWFLSRSLRPDRP